jgi:SagB-type dehydrogenase family enzyme
MKYKVKRVSSLIGLFHGGEFFIKVLSTGKTAKASPVLIQFLSRCDDWISLEDAAEFLTIPAKEAAIYIDKLVKMGILEMDIKHTPNASIRYALENGWNIFELIFHRNSHHISDYQSKNSKTGIKAKSHKKLSDPMEIRKELTNVMRSRRSIRKFSRRELGIDVVSTLLDLVAQPTGVITQEEARETSLITSDPMNTSGKRRYPHPVGGCINTLKIYLAVNRVRELSEAIYEYEEDRHQLNLINNIKYDEFCSAMLPGLEWTNKSAMIIIIAAEMSELRSHYKHPYFLTLLEAGHLIQNILLIATALGIGACELGAIEEDAFFDFIDSQYYRLVPVGVVVAGAVD